MGKFNRDNISDREIGHRDFGKRNFGGGRGFGGRDSERSGMHKAICNKCGKECEVPFKPTGNRPVFCSNCFEKPGVVNSGRPQGNDFSRPRFSKPSFGDKRMFEAICDKCGNKCEVPFQPSPGKPIYCNQCFDKGGNTGGRSSDQFKEQFNTLNAKLDKILKALNLSNSSEVAEKKVEEKKEVKEKNAKTKAVVKKVKTKKKK